MSEKKSNPSDTYGSPASSHSFKVRQCFIGAVAITLKGEEEKKEQREAVNLEGYYTVSTAGCQ